MGHTANIVDIEQIDFRKAETLLAVIEAPHDAIIAVIKDLTKIEAIVPAGIERVFRQRRRQCAARTLIGHQAPHLGRNNCALALFTQHIAENVLAAAIAIHRRTVIIADAAIPAGFQQSVGVRAGNGRIKPTQRCSSQTKRRHSQAGTAKRSLFGCLQMHGYLLNNATNAALLVQRLVIQKPLALFGMRFLFHRILPKNRFALFGMRCLFQRLIGASLPKRNRKSMRMRTVYSLANKPSLTAANFLPILL